VLGRHVGDLAFDVIGGLVDHVRGGRDAKIEHPRGAVGADVAVLRRHVAMHETEGISPLALRFVGGVEALQEAARDRDRDAWRDRLTELAALSHEPRERLAGDVFHDVEELARDRNDLVGGHHVRVPHARGEATLGEEHAYERGIFRQIGQEALDRDHPRDALIAQDATKMHRRHAPRRKLSVESVAADGSAIFGVGDFCHE
jgi:hypothetical protein